MQTDNEEITCVDFSGRQYLLTIIFFQLNALFYRFFLILGISMEALCNSVSRLEESTVTHCLMALRALLASDWPREQVSCL